MIRGVGAAASSNHVAPVTVRGCLGLRVKMSAPPRAMRSHQRHIGLDQILGYTNALRDRGVTVQPVIYIGHEPAGVGR